MTVVAAVHSHGGLSLLAQARRLGHFDEAEALVLLVWADEAIPEVGTRLIDQVGAVGPARVIDLNSVLAPFHPAQWDPGDVELAAWRWVLTDALPAVTELIAEDLDNPTCRALAKLFPDASLRGLEAGLGAYGPAASRRSHAFEQRIIGGWHADLVSGLTPISREWDLAFGLPTPPEHQSRQGLVLGSDLVGAGLANASAEVALHTRLIAAAARDGGVVRFRPDPATTPARRWLIERAARSAGAELELVGPDLDALFADGRPRVVYGTASPLLLWLSDAGIPTHTIGVSQLLQKLVPYHHPARPGLTLIDALLRTDAERLEVSGAQDLLAAVSYVMRPEFLPAGRQLSLDYLAKISEQQRRRYFSLGRLEALGLARRRGLAERVWGRLRHRDGRG